MSDTKHTPGPWAWGDMDSTSGLEPEEGDRFVLRGKPERAGANPYRPLVLVVDDNVSLDQPDRDLIAAAPDLLAACEQMLDWRAQAKDYMHCLAVQEAMRAAVAKAKGGGR